MERAAFEEEVRRRAVREAAAELDSPMELATRYGQLTSIEAEPAPQPRPVARRAEPRWLAAQALQPDLLELHTADREPEIVDTASNVYAPASLTSLSGLPVSDDLGFAAHLPSAWPEGLWAKVRNGHQQPLRY